MQIERYSHVMHIVFERSRAFTCRWQRIRRSASGHFLPALSSGAPKNPAMQIISELGENAARLFMAGAIGNFGIQRETWIPASHCAVPY